MKLIVGISGASGVIYGVRLLEALQANPDVETHLIMSPYGRMNVEIETDKSPQEVEMLADVANSTAATLNAGRVSEVVPIEAL